MNKDFLKSSGVISIMTFLSRILGLIRDYFIAKYFGANAATDAFLVAFRIPNFFRRLFAEGAFSQAFVPILAELKSNSEDKQINDAISHIGTRLLTILIIITIIAVIASPIVIFIFAWGFYFNSDNTQFELASNMLRITFPYLLLISLTAFAGGILNTYNKFAVPAFTPVILNIAIILSAIYLGEYLTNPIMALPWGVLIGGVAQLLFQLPFLIKIKKLPKIKYGPHPVLKKLKKRMLPTIFGVSIGQINLLIDTMIASLLVSGSVSWLYYADRLLELPLALIGIALATVALTKLSKHFANKDNEEFTKTINYSIKLGLLLGAPACAGLLLLAEPLIITLFQYDEFNATAANQSANSLIAYASGLLAFIMVKILAPVFLSMGDTKTPVKVGVIAMLTNIVLNFILVYSMAHVGLALATSIAAFVNAYLLYYYLNKKNIFKINKELKKIFIKILLATCVMSAFIIFYNSTIEFYLAANMWNRAVAVSSTISIGALIYFATLWLLGIKNHYKNTV